MAAYTAAMRRRYRFVSGWQVPLAPEEVWRRVRAALVAGAAPGWRAVRVTTTRLEPGSTMHMLVRSPLGFRLRMRILLTDVTAPSRIAARSRGDLDGVGTLEITPTPGGSAMTWIWQVEPTRRGMRVAGVVLHPLFYSRTGW